MKQLEVHICQAGIEHSQVESRMEPGTMFLDRPGSWRRGSWRKANWAFTAKTAEEARLGCSNLGGIGLESKMKMSCQAVTSLVSRQRGENDLQGPTGCNLSVSDTMLYGILIT